LSDKQELTTRDGKPYHRVTFRDSVREVSFPIWNDAPLAKACQNEWQIGEFFRMKAKYRETNYGPQLEIREIRTVKESDADDGFDPLMCQARSRFDSQEMFAELIKIANERIENNALRDLVVGIYEDHRADLLNLPAATRNHHAFAGGYLEHVRNVVRTCVYLADAYAVAYPDLSPPLDKNVLIAGALLHDIGKLRELRTMPTGAEYTAAGSLIGHVLQGRDIVREAAANSKVDAETLLRLEHVIVSHQRLPEWGAPKPPMTPEALLVHYADDIDAKYKMMVDILSTDANAGPMTSRRNVLGQAVYRGGE
jgi:3'-5' exoribonuclease